MEATATTSSVSGNDLSNVPVKEEAAIVSLDRLLPELNAIPEKDLVQVSVDIPLSVSMVLGNLPEIMRLRDQIVKSTPDFNLEMLDKLEERTLAVYEAHGRYLIATKPRNELDQEIEKGTQLRETLLSDAKALIARGLIEEEKLSELLGSVGHKNLAVDLNVLHHALKESWPQIQGKSAVRLEEIEAAMVASRNIIRLVGLRDEGTTSVAEATDIRLRAYTLFYNSYNGVRRAVAYLRWNEGDADKIAPSLHSGRSPRRKGSDGDGEVPAPTGSGAPASPGQPIPGTHTSVPAGSVIAPGAAVTKPSNAAGTGTRESEPFMR